MAKKISNEKSYHKVIKRRTKPTGLKHRKKLGPKSNMRVR